MEERRTATPEAPERRAGHVKLVESCHDERGGGRGRRERADALRDAIAALPEPLVEEALAFVLFLKSGQRRADDVSTVRWWEVCRILCGVADPAIRDGFLQWAHAHARSAGWRMLTFACACAVEARRAPDVLVSALAADVVDEIKRAPVAGEARIELAGAFRALVASDERDVLQPLLARMLHGGDDDFELAAEAIVGAMDARRERRTGPLDDLAGTNLDALAGALRDATYPRAAELVRRVHDKKLPSGIPVLAAALEGGAAGAAVTLMASLSRRLAVDVGEFWAELLSADASVDSGEGSGGYYLRLSEETPIGALPELEEHFDYFILNVRAWWLGEKLHYDRATGAGVPPDEPFIRSVAAYMLAGTPDRGALDRRALERCREIGGQIGTAFLDERPFVIGSSILAPCLEGALRDRKLAPTDKSRKLFDARRWRPPARAAARREGLSHRGRRFFPGTETENARTHVLTAIEEQFWPPLLALASRTYPGDVGERLHLALWSGLVSLVRVALRAAISSESYLKRYLTEATGEVGPRVSGLVPDPSVREAALAGAASGAEPRFDAWVVDPQLRPAAEAVAAFKELYRDEVRQLQAHRREITRFVEAAGDRERAGDLVFLEHLFDDRPIHLAGDDPLWSIILPVVVSVRYRT